MRSGRRHSLLEQRQAASPNPTVCAQARLVVSARHTLTAVVPPVPSHPVDSGRKPTGTDQTPHAAHRNWP